MTKLKHTLKLLLYSCLILLVACEKENFDVMQEHQNAKIKEAKFNDLMASDAKFRALYQKVNGKHMLSRTAFEDQNGFTIVNTNIKIIEADSVTSYTMLIQRDSITNDNCFENLVIQ